MAGRKINDGTDRIRQVEKIKDSNKLKFVSRVRRMRKIKNPINKWNSAA